ncbi:MAG: hypothetical protein E7388_00150 [Ruminococcaceae bacterium]|nr:hypothetical protein [Oscillospiraceae bacterium]
MNVELKNFLDTYLEKEVDTTKISVFPLPCGIGKSEYIKYTIAETLQNGKGLIVVTDQIDRLKNYTVAQDEELTEYINKNKKFIAILTSETIKEELKDIHSKPVVLMSTQRYFSLTKDEIINYTSNHWVKRNKIIFDEKPYILDARRVTINSLNKIDTALKQALDDTIDQKNKVKLIECWKVISEKLQTALDVNEEQNSGYKREGYFNFNDLKTEDDIYIFLKLYPKYKRQLNKYNLDVVKDIEAVIQLFNEGVITSQKVKVKKSGKEYNKYFTVIVNHVNKLFEINAKIYVLDGTADISPEYQLKCFELINCDNFQRDLSNLTINIIDVNTSKERLTKLGAKSDSLITTIIDYVKSLPQNIDTVFTYKDISQKFENNFKNVNWFGNIKGSNQYRGVKHICQVGLHRYSELIYMLYANAINQFNDSDKTFNQRIYDMETIDNIRCNLIITDIEQNLFRCKIRNNDNREQCTYTLICTVKEKNELFEGYQPIINMIKSRYEKLGAIVNVVDTPAQFRLFKIKERKQDTSAKKIIRWLDAKEKGYVFKIADMLKDLKINHKQFDKIKRNNVSIMDLFNSIKTEKRGYYEIK